MKAEYRQRLQICQVVSHFVAWMMSEIRFESNDEVRKCVL